MLWCGCLHQLVDLLEAFRPGTCCGAFPFRQSELVALEHRAFRLQLELQALEFCLRLFVRGLLRRHHVHIPASLAERQKVDLESGVLQAEVGAQLLVQ